MQSDIANYFREKAAYRQRLASENPQDAGKNIGYSKSLNRLADYVESLQSDDATLQSLANCEELFEFGFFDPPSHPDGCATEADTMAIHCGPRGDEISAEKCGEWFSNWAQVAIDEAKLLSKPREQHWAAGDD